MTQLEALKEIAKRDGGLLRPQAVVDAARPKNSPLHGAFCWNNTEAAQKYRLLQAQQLIRSFKIKLEDGGTAPAFVNLSIDRTGDKGDNPYRPAEDVAKAENLMAVAERDALEELNAIRGRYEQIKKLQDVWNAIDAHQGR